MSNATLPSTGSGGGSAGGDIETVGADAESNTSNRQKVSSHGMAFNGTTWDRIRSAITSATSTFTGIINALPLARYLATPGTLTDGQAQPLRADSLGALITNPGVQVGTITNTPITINATTTTILAASTSLLGCDIINTGSQTVFVKAGASATTADIPIVAGATYRFPVVPYNQAINGIVTSGTGTIIAVTGA